VAIALPVSASDAYTESTDAATNLQMAMKTNLGVFYFQDSIPIEVNTVAVLW
jgi:hypothetical protein